MDTVRRFRMLRVYKLHYCAVMPLCLVTQRAKKQGKITERYSYMYQKHKKLHIRINSPNMTRLEWKLLHYILYTYYWVFGVYKLITSIVKLYVIK